MMQNYTNGYTPLTVENIWYIFYILWDKGAHMLFWKEKQNFCIILACITCWKSTIEILEQRLNIFKVNKKNNKMISMNLNVLKPYMLTLNIYYTLFYCFDCWLWACNAGKNCKNFLCCCHKTTGKIINYILLKSLINFH